MYTSPGSIHPASGDGITQGSSLNPLMPLLRGLLRSRVAVYFVTVNMSVYIYALFLFQFEIKILIEPKLRYTV